MTASNIKMINRVGEIKNNRHGSKMVIEKYNTNQDILVKFVEFGNLVHTNWSHFSNGMVKNVYDKTIYGIGFIGEGDYTTVIGKDRTPQYMAWKSMIYRCYKENNGTYKGCSVDPEWHNFQNFAKWWDDNYYEIEEQKMSLDKDILVKGNKVYSPDTCIFVPSNINNLFVKSDARRGKYPIGVYLHKASGKYNVKCNDGARKAIYLGTFDNPIQAFGAYKVYKENLIKQIAEEYKKEIPLKLYEAMTNYIVEIND